MFIDKASWGGLYFVSVANMKLVIVESPAKCITIKRYLGDNYIVKASLGHIRDLATSGKDGLGVDVNNDFSQPIVNKDKQHIVKDLKKTVQQCDEVIWQLTLIEKVKLLPGT